MKRYKVIVNTQRFTYNFEIELEEKSETYYYTDNTSMIFKLVNGRTLIVPRLDTCVEITPLIPETTWKEK